MYSGEKATTFTFDANGNNTGVVQYDGMNLQMSYGKENRLVVCPLRVVQS